MPLDIYIYLKGGRGDGFVPKWNGEAPVTEGTFDNADGTMSAEGREVGEPYRDIFQQGGQPFQVANTIDLHGGGDSHDPVRASRDYVLPAGNVYYATGVRQETDAFFTTMGANGALLSGPIYGSYASIQAENLERVVYPDADEDGEDDAVVLDPNDEVVVEDVEVLRKPRVIGKSTLQAAVSDELAHTKPRQFTKVCSWLVFTSVDGAAEYTFKYRKADVLGWGAKPRTE